MKAFVRWGAILGLVSSSFLAPALTGRLVANALPEQQVVEQLQTIPLFMITNQQGVPLTQTIPNPSDKTKEVQVYTFFVAQQDAQTALTTIKTSNPDIGKQAKISPVSLGNVVKLALESRKQKASVEVNILPSQQQFQAAVAILKQNGQLVDKNGQLVTKDGKPFPGGTPLFYGTDSKTGGLLSVEGVFKDNGQDKKVSIVPFYFDKQALQTDLDQAKKQNPQLTATTKIEVVMLDALLSTMLSSTDTSVGQFQLVPNRDSIEFIQKQTPAQGSPQAAPGTAPKPTPKP